MNDRDTTIVSQVAALAIESVTRPDRWPQMCDLIVEEVGFTSFAIMAYDLARRRPALFEGSSVWRNDAGARIIADCGIEHHAYANTVSLPAGSVIGEGAGFADTTGKTVFDEPFRRRVIEHVGGGNRSAMRLTDHGPFADVALCSDMTGGLDGSPALRRLAPHLTPILARAVEGRRVVDSATRHLGQFRAVFDQLSVGVAFCDAGGRIHAMNAQMTDYVRAGDGLSDLGGILGPGCQADLAAWHLACHAAQATGQGFRPESTILRVHRPSGDLPLVLRVLPIKDPDLSESQLMVIAVDTERSDHISAEGLMALDILDQDELDIADLVVRGMPEIEIARNRDRSADEVAQTMKAIAAKLRCRDLSDLQRLAFAYHIPIRRGGFRPQ